MKILRHYTALPFVIVYFLLTSTGMGVSNETFVVWTNLVLSEVVLSGSLTEYSGTSSPSPNCCDNEGNPDASCMYDTQTASADSNVADSTKPFAAGFTSWRGYVGGPLGCFAGVAGIEEYDASVTIDLGEYDDAETHLKAELMARVVYTYELGDDVQIVVATNAYPLTPGGTTSLTFTEFHSEWPSFVGSEDSYDESYGVSFSVRMQMALEEFKPSCHPSVDEYFAELISEYSGSINVITGNSGTRTDALAIPSPGIPLVLSHSHDSAASDPSDVWSHNYDMRLSDGTSVFQGGTNEWKILNFGAQTVHFRDMGEGGYATPSGTSLELTVFSNGTASVSLGGGQTADFNSSGYLDNIHDAFGNEVSLTYTNGVTASNLLARAEHSNGLGIDMVYSNDVLIRAESPLASNYVEYEYDGNGRLTNLVHQFGTESVEESFSYDSTTTSVEQLVLHNLPDGYEWDAIYETNQSGEVTNRATNASVGTNEFLALDVDYGLSDDLTRTVERVYGSYTNTYIYRFHPTFLKVESVIGPTGSEDLPRRETRHEFDAAGNRTVSENWDWGVMQWSRTEMQYDDLHQVTNTAYGLNTYTLSNRWNYTWNSNFNTIASITDPEDRSIEFDYTNGLISATRLIVDSNTSYQTDYAYTTNGLLAAVTNANGNAVEYTYDGYGYPNLITPDAGPEIDLDYNVLGHLEAITMPWSGMSGPTEREIELDPDGMGRIRSITYPNSLEETFAYDGVGNILTNVDTAGRSTRYEYEPLGRLRSVTRELIGSSSTQDVEIAFAYDQQLNTLAVTDPLGREVESYVLDELDRATSITNVDEQVMTVDYGVGEHVNFITRFDQTDVVFDYDNDGRLHQVFYTDDTNTYAYYRNDLLKMVENAVSTVSNTYNSVNRLTEMVASEADLGLSWTNDYAYAPAGQVTNRTSVAGSTDYDYDGAERLETLTDLESGEFEYSYNAYNGLVSSVEYPSGITCSYDYDIMDRLKGINYATSSADVLSIDYDYDNATGMITGKTQTAEQGIQKATYEYDTLDRLTSETRSDATGETLDSATYSYDLAGNRTEKTRNGISVDYELGDGNRLSSWDVPGSSTGALISVSGSSTETIGLDPRFGERMINDAEAQASGTNFWHSSVLVSTGSVDLVASMGDEAGNLGYATNSITISIITNAAYGYDNAGNLTNVSYNSDSQTLDLSWNQQYQLASVSTNSSVAESYTYDALGRRLTTTMGSDTIVHMYDGIHCIADTDTNGVPLRSYTYGPGVDNILAMTVHESTETNTYYYLTDHVGSVLAITDDSGSVVETYQYDAYGRTTVYDADGTPVGESGLGNRFAFQGREQSWTTGLTYFRARWYDSVTGRWLSKDPIGISGGLNQYVAFGGNGVNQVDPSGLQQSAADRFNDDFNYWTGFEDRRQSETQQALDKSNDLIDSGFSGYEQAIWGYFFRWTPKGPKIKVGPAKAFRKGKISRKEKQFLDDIANEFLECNASSAEDAKGAIDKALRKMGWEWPLDPVIRSDEVIFDSKTMKTVFKDSGEVIIKSLNDNSTLLHMVPGK